MPKLLLSLLAGAALASAPALAGQAPDSRIEAIVHAMPLNDKLDYLGGLGFETRPIPAEGVPAFVMSDGALGLRVDDGVPATAYAGGIGLAASWDEALARRIGAAIGAEARARGIHFLLAPGLNMARTAGAGRNFEYLGEDPLLTARIGVGYIDGVQSQGVSATAKHFFGNDSDYDRHRVNAIIDERTMREIYLPPFEEAIREAHVGAVITGYNRVNGRWLNENADFNIGLLRREWGFTGPVMTDWVAGHDTVAMANGGTDLEMPIGEYMNAEKLAPAIAAGQVSTAAIDDKLRHILDPAIRFGWLDRPQRDDRLPLISSEASAIALQSARESIVLLKNERRALPLDRHALKTILVVGPDAWPAQPTGGGSAAVRPIHATSLLEGVTAAAGPGVVVQYERGIPTLRELAQATRFYRHASGDELGLTLAEFDHDDPSGTPIATRIVPSIDAPGVTWLDFIDNPEAVGTRFATARNHRSARRWTGWYAVDKPGRYVVALLGSGEWNRNRVMLDGRKIIDNWAGATAYQPTLTLDLAPGRHEIVVEEAQHGPLGGKLQLAIAREDSLVSERAEALAARADAVIAAVGFDRASESEGADRGFALPVGQDALLEAITAANRHTVTVVTAGSGVDMHRWIDATPALLYGWYGGQAGGQAMAEVLFGDVVPSGHLPLSIPRREADDPAFAFAYPKAGSDDVVYQEGVFMGYRGLERAGTTPLFAFGYGLSYTSFAISKLSLPATAKAAAPAIDVGFDVTNTGTRAAATVAQLYVADGHAPVPRPIKELKGFARVTLAPGETRHVTLPLDRRAFAYWDTKTHGWTVAPGSFRILVGQSSAAIEATGSIVLKAQ